MKIILSLAVFLLSGCAQLASIVPSFWDDNQSRSIIDVRARVELINCDRSQAPQLEPIVRELAWFRLYSESKGQRQQDVLKLVEPMRETAEDWYRRVTAEGYKENPVYCKLKKQVMQAQSKRAAEAVLGRF